MNRLPEDLRAAVSSALAPSEHIALVAPAVGCTLVLTDARLLVVREGASYRPRSGIRSWVLDRTLNLHPGPVRNTSGQLAIESPRRTTSVFYRIEHKPAIDQVVAEVRRRIYAAG